MLSFANKDLAVVIQVIRGLHVVSFGFFVVLEHVSINFWIIFDANKFLLTTHIYWPAQGDASVLSIHPATTNRFLATF